MNNHVSQLNKMYWKKKKTKPYTSPFEHTHHTLVPLVPPLPAGGTARAAFNKKNKTSLYSFQYFFSIKNPVTR